MPTQEEIDKLAGTPAPVADTPADQKPAVVPLEEFQKVEQQKAEVLQFAKRRDDEIRTLRKENEELKKKSELTPRKSEVIDDEEDDFDRKLREKGYVPLSEVKETIQKESTVLELAKKNQQDMQELSEKYPFINQFDLLEFMKDRGRITVQEAVELKYKKELADFSSTPDIPETDNGRRTLSVQPAYITDGGGLEKPSPYLPDKTPGTGYQSNRLRLRTYIAGRMQKVQDQIAGNR